MKKKKKYIILITIIIISIVIIVTQVVSNTKEKPIDETIKICNNIKSKINSKEDIILFIKQNNNNMEQKDAIEKVKDNHKNSNIYEISDKNINNKCIKKLLTNINTYDIIKKENSSSMIIYKNGNYKGIFIGLSSYDNIKRYLEEKEIIKKEEIKEEITINEYKKNTKQKKYLLLIIAKEEERKKLTISMKKIFSDYKYNIVNKNSEEGRKIIKELKEKNKTTNEYPKLNYYEEGKLIKSSLGATEEMLKNYKADIEK